MPSVLIVDDLTAIHDMLETVISPTGYETSFAKDGPEALNRFKSQDFDVVVADISMQPMDGITLLKELKDYDRDSVVVMMTGYASLDTAIKALKYGAFDYIRKPFKVDELIQTLHRAVEFRKIHRETRNATPSAEAAPADFGARIVGEAPKMQRLVQQMEKLVGARMPVLIQGESGTGKKLFAELLHRANHPQEGAGFVLIDCSLSSDENFSEGLLGESGAGGEWTQQAKGGTLFLQHIEHLPLQIQTDLVSVIKNNVNNFHLICSSSQDIEQLVDAERFHDELFYRIASFPVLIPPLRERNEDIPHLVRRFIAETRNPTFESGQIELTDDALEVLSRYPWPGNVAELRQVVSSLVSQTDSRLITSQQLPLRLRDLKDWPSLRDYLARQEREYVSLVMRACKQDRELAGKILQCSIDQIDRLIG